MDVSELEKEMRNSFSNLREDMLFFKNNINELKSNLKSVQEDIIKAKQDLDYVKALRQEDIGRPKAKLLEEQEFTDVDEEGMPEGEELPTEQYAEEPVYDEDAGEAVTEERMQDEQQSQYASVMDVEDEQLQQQAPSVQHRQHVRPQQQVRSSQPVNPNARRAMSPVRQQQQQQARLPSRPVPQQQR